MSDMTLYMSTIRAMFAGPQIDPALAVSICLQYVSGHSRMQQSTVDVCHFLQSAATQSEVQDSGESVLQKFSFCAGKAKPLVFGSVLMGSSRDTEGAAVNM